MKLFPKHRGIPTSWIRGGVPATNIPLTGFAYHSWQQWRDQIMASPDPMGAMFSIVESSFHAPEHGYLWIAALFPSPIRYNMANRMLGCDRYYNRNATARRRMCELSGITQEELREMPWDYVVPKTTRSVQYARRSTMTDVKDYNNVSVVDYLVALRTRNPEYLERIEAACSSVVDDSLKHGAPLNTEACVTFRLFILISYMCGGRPEDVTVSTMPSDDPKSHTIYSCVAIRSNDQTFIFNGIHH